VVFCELAHFHFRGSVVFVFGTTKVQCSTLNQAKQLLKLRWWNV